MIDIILRKITFRNLFLIDAFGALFSSISIGLIIPFFFDGVGLPHLILSSLAIAAFIYSGYSFSCYLFLKNNLKTYLKYIAFSNLIYLLITLFVIVFYYAQISVTGLIYFILEAIIITILVSIELKIIYSK
ncbi:MAG: hypothetical protein WED33_10235 [Bacteroidia bacterium]